MEREERIIKIKKKLEEIFELFPDTEEEMEGMSLMLIFSDTNINKAVAARYGTILPLYYAIQNHEDLEKVIGTILGMITAEASISDLEKSLITMNKLVLSKKLKNLFSTAGGLVVEKEGDFLKHFEKNENLNLFEHFLKEFSDIIPNKPKDNESEQPGCNFPVG